MADVQWAPAAPHDLNHGPGKLPSLRSNRGTYVDPSTTGWMRPTSRNTPLKEIRRRYSEDGYVWVKNLLPQQDVYDMREQYGSLVEGLTGLASC